MAGVIVTIWLLGTISLAEMVEVFKLVYNDREGGNSQKDIDKVTRKAEDMFDILDADGNGKISQVSKILNTDESFPYQDEFVSGCLADEDLVRELYGS